MFLETAIEAAAEAGKLLRKNFGAKLDVNAATHHDIKLEIDEQAQKLITRVILADFPDHCIFGEEGLPAARELDCREVAAPVEDAFGEGLFRGQRAQHAVFDGGFADEVDDGDGPGLVFAPGAGDALFETGGIPRQVAVDDDAGGLEVKSA